MTNYSSENLNFSLKTPLGPDVLIVSAFSGNEKLSQLYNYSIEVQSGNRNINFDSIVGKQVSLSISLPDGKKRFISGHVGSFTQVSEGVDLSNYKIELVPWLWFLTQRANCRIFQQKSIPDIIKKIFDDAGFKGMYDDRRLSGAYSPREYCVQYRETEFNFVSRIMEEEGIFYYFEHKDGQHTLILGDSPEAFKPITPPDTIPYYLAFGDTAINEGVTNFVFEQSVRPTKVTFRDYDFQNPSAGLESRYETGSERELYDYPGKYLVKSDGDRYAKNWLEAKRTEHKVFTGRSTSRRLTVGGTFKLTEHPRESYNDTYTISALIQHGNHNAENITYETDFRCVPASVPYRPDRITQKPVIPGLQTATVTGPSSEELWLDEYGRIKVQFHWDREGMGNEKSSCFIRVAQQWAGKSWGMIFNPRIGQEVIVQFEEGDPDRPVITGSLYNAEQMPPYALPANGTQNGIRTRSSKEGEPDNCNEIRFEDKKGQEHLFIHAEKDFKLEVEKDEAHSVGNNRTKDIVKDETVTIGNNRTETVKKDESITIGENRTESVGKNETVSVSDNRSLSVGKDDTVNIGKNKTEKIGSNLSLSVTKNGDISFEENLTSNIGKKETRSVGKEYQLDVGNKLVIKCGDASITMKSDGKIEISGKDITIGGTGKINVKASGDLTLKGSKINSN